MALVPVAVGGAAYLIKYRDRMGDVAWWVFCVVPLGIAAVALAHAYAAAAFGRRRADNVFKVALVFVLLGGVWFLTKYLESR